MRGPESGAGGEARALRRCLLVCAALGWYGLAGLLVIDGRAAAHATSSGVATAVTLAAATALLLGAGFAAVSPRRYRIGALALGIGAAWLSEPVVGWIGGPVSLRALAVLLSPFGVPALVHLILASSDGHLYGRVATGLTATAYLVTAGFTAVTVLARDPLFDPSCWQDCGVRVLALTPDRDLAVTAATGGRVLVVALAVTGVVAAGWRAVSPRQRAPSALVAAPAALALAASALWAAAGLADPPERRTGGGFWLVHLVESCSLGLLGMGLGVVVWRDRRRERQLRRLAHRLGAVPPVGSLEARLAELLGDPTLRVVYWLPESQRFVDSDGHTVSPVPTNTRTAIELRRGDDLMAVISFERADLDAEALIAQLGAATRLALDNERLQVGVEAQLTELRLSRERIVATADESRRQFERDLHDGVQADLVALLLETSRRAAAAERNGDRVAAEALSDLAEHVAAAAARLRELTHGLFPAELAEAGLEAALWTLTDDAPVPVALRVDLSRRPPAAVERVAYLVAVEALSRTAGAAPMGLTVSGGDTVVAVRVAPVDEAVPVSLGDRVGALGGLVRASGDGWEVELPCEW